MEDAIAPQRGRAGRFPRGAKSGLFEQFLLGFGD
jgi:hypothetical protein